MRTEGHSITQLPGTFFLLFLTLTALFLIVICTISTVSGDPDSFGVEISANTTGGQTGDPGELISYDLTITNAGDVNDSFEIFILHGEPGWSAKHWAWVEGLPDNSTGNASEGSTGTIAPGAQIYLDLIIEIPEIAPGIDVPPRGIYYLLLLAQSTSNRSVSDELRFDVTMNAVYRVEVSSDEFTGLDGEPGDMLEYTVKVKNSGNTNETYQISVLGSGNPSLEDGKQWTDVGGLTPSGQVTIPVGETKYLPVIITIPEFTVDDDEAEKGSYGVKIKAESTNQSNEDSELIFEFEVLEMYKVRLWLDIPGKNATICECEPTGMVFRLNVRNLGNTADDIIVSVPNDHFCGEMKDWTAKFGTQPSKQLTLDSLSQQSVTLTLTIDNKTEPGNYQLQVLAESQGDTTIHVYTTLYINLTKAEFGVELQKYPTAIRKVNPADESEIEFKFTLTNTGNQDDTYTIEVETPLASGVYKGWTMEFEDKDYNRVNQLSVPTDLKGNTDLYCSKNNRVDITLYVVVAIDEDEGNYGDIAISATSNNDISQIEYLFFNLTVVLPNIRITDQDTEFYIEPDSGIEEGDSVDINVRLYNDGGAETDEFWVFFYNGKSDSPTDLAGNYIALEKVENIPAGQYIDVLGTWDEIPGGENDIYVYADKPIRNGDGMTLNTFNMFSDEGLVHESKENDNTASIGNEFQQAIDLRPDLTIIDIDFDDREQGKTTTVTVTVANVGSAKALEGSAQIWLKIGGIPIMGKQTNGIYPFIPEDIDIGDIIDVEFTWDIPDEDKNFTVKASIDSYHSRDSHPFRTYVQTEESDVVLCCDPDPLPLFGLCSLFVVFIVISSVLFLRKRKRLQNPQIWRKDRIPTAFSTTTGSHSNVPVSHAPPPPQVSAPSTSTPPSQLPVPSPAPPYHSQSPSPSSVLPSPSHMPPLPTDPGESVVHGAHQYPVIAHEQIVPENRLETRPVENIAGNDNVTPSLTRDANGNPRSEHGGHHHEK